MTDVGSRLVRNLGDARHSLDVSYERVSTPMVSLPIGRTVVRMPPSTGCTGLRHQRGYGSVCADTAGSTGESHDSHRETATAPLEALSMRGLTRVSGGRPCDVFLYDGQHGQMI